MAGLSLEHPLPFIFGIVGNLISFMVFLSPIPTFYRVYRKKSTEGFQSVPYVVAVFSCMLWIYYALVKTDSILLITINSFGCFIETAYITVYLIYAINKARMFTIQIFVVLNVVTFAAIVLITQLLFTGSQRVTTLGWICVAFSVCVFAAPLSIIRLVIRTKSVEFMPFYLSFFLTLNAIAWFGYGLFTNDLYVELPNTLGFLLSIAQMVLYMIYKKKKKAVVDPPVPEHIVKVTEIIPTPASDLQVIAEDDDHDEKAKKKDDGEGMNKAKMVTEEGLDVCPV